jgi:serine protease Do
LLWLVLVGMTVLAAVMGGIFIGNRLWPRVVMVEKRVIAPVVEAADRPRNDPEALPNLIDGACPAVVAVKPAEPANAGTDPAAGRSHHSGSRTKAASTPPLPLAGFLISGDGYLVTSGVNLPAHGEISVLLNDGRRLDATRAGFDALSGLALLKVEGSDFPVLDFADQKFPRTGEWGIALAAPNGSGCIADFGIISSDFVAERQGLRTYVRMRPRLETSMVGAPVLDVDGKVMGIAGLGPDSATSHDASALLPASTAGGIASQMLRNSAPPDNAFGIVADEIPAALAFRLGADRQRGAVVSLVAVGSPADKAGLKAGDVILAAAGSPVSGASEFARSLDSADDEVSLDILRGKQRLNIVMISRRSVHHSR